MKISRVAALFLFILTLFLSSTSPFTVSNSFAQELDGAGSKLFNPLFHTEGMCAMNINGLTGFTDVGRHFT